MVELRYAADSKESDWLTRISAQRSSLFARPDTTPKRLFFKLRGATLTAHPDQSYPELWRSPVKQIRDIDSNQQSFVLRLERSTITLQAPSADVFVRWVDALSRSAGTEFHRFYKRERTIGKGHFSHVYIASDRATCEKFAVKVIKKDKNDLEKSKKFIRREVKVLSITHHPNLVKAVDFFSCAGKPHIVMEFVEGGSLRDLIRKRKRLTEEQARPILRGILKAISYLHSLNIVHRDIKPENILMHRPDFPKVTDFGLATFRNEAKNIHSVVGTPSYVAPEVIRNVPYGPPADIWSCGVLLYFMVAGERPFTGDTREDIKRAVLEGDLRFPSQIFAPDSLEIKQLINSMLNYDQDRRPTATDILAHPWLHR